MQADRNDNRKAEAAANLARRKQELRRKKQKKQKKLRAFVMLGMLLIVVLVLIIGCTEIVKITARKIADSRAAGKAAEEALAEAERGSIVLGLKGSKVQLVLQGEPYIENGAFAIDRRQGALPSDDIKASGKVDTSAPGDYTVTYSIESNGISVETERTVRVLSEEDYGDKASDVPVMMYHWVYSADDMPDNVDGNWILDTTLAEQMEYLRDNNFYYPGWKELRAWVDDEITLPEKSVIITFDDGKKAFLEHGIPVLEKYEVPATSFMIGWEKNKGAEKVRDYPSPYIEFESHTFAMHQQAVPRVKGHKGRVAVMSTEEIREDLAMAAELVGSNDAIAYPYGDYTDSMLEAVREQGISCAFTIEYDRVRKGMDPARLPRIRVLGNESFETWKYSVN